MIDLTKIIPTTFDGSDYTQRENLKLEGSKEYKNSSNANQKINGIIKIMYSHYCRSLESANGQKRKHPQNFEEYARHWLWSDDDKIIDDINVKNILIEEYGCPNEPKINKGESYYYQKNKNT
jgi:hypothetical protein